MKKFLAIVMCLTMALSMMTVVSFAAGTATVTVGTVENVEAGTTIQVPITANISDGAKQIAVVFENTANYTITAFTWNSALDLNTGLSSFDPAKNMSGKKVPYIMTVTNSPVSGEVKLGEMTVEVADTASGEIEVPFFMVSIQGVSAANITKVAGKIAIKASAPSAEIIDVPVDVEAGAVIKVLQFANAAEFGIRYTGSNAEYAGVEFASLAPATATKAAVKVIGLDDAFEAYAK